MSQMMTEEIDFKTADDIKKVLGHFGLRYEESETGIDIRGYGGVTSRKKGNIVVRKEMFGGSADMGFIRKADDSWEIHCESNDRNTLTQLKNVHLYLKVESVAKRKHRKMEIRSGQVPTKLDRYGDRNGEIVIAIQA